MKKFVASLAVLPLTFALAACGSSSDSASASKDDEITVGVVGADPAHDKLVEEAKKEGLNVKIVDFTDFNQPNPALSGKETDLNWFQHIDYLANYNVEQNDDLAVVGSTAIYPLGLYSQKYKDVKDIPEGAEIAVPNDPTNLTRSILLLADKGLIELKEKGLQYPSLDDIDTEKSKVKVLDVDAAQAARSLSDVAAAVINNTYVSDANLNPSDAITADDASSDGAKKYVNVFASKPEDKDNEDYKKLVEIYHSEPVQEVVKDHTKGTAVDVNESSEDLNKTLDEVEEAVKNK